MSACLDAGLAFPCEFPVKVMGRAHPGFAQAVVEVLRRHAPEFDASALQVRSSREGAWLSLTATIRARSREQLDMLYRDLCDHPMVTLVL